MNSSPTGGLGLLGRLKNLLGSVFNLFAKGGSTGGVVVRQPGGTPGLNEVQIYNDGTNTWIVTQQGRFKAYQTTSNRAIIEASKFYVGDNGAACLSSAGIVTYSGPIGFTGSQILDPTALPDIDAGFYRIAAAVTGVRKGSGNPGWLQNTAARSRNTSAVTNATATMANLSDLTLTLIAGRKYTGRLVLFASNSVAAEGVQVDFNGGTATMTSVEFGVSAAMGATAGVRTSTALGTAVTLTALPDTNDVAIEIPFVCVCNAGGTLIPRFAEASHSSGTATVQIGSYLWSEDMPN